MNANFRRFKILALQSKAGEELKDDLNGTMSSFRGVW